MADSLTHPETRRARAYGLARAAAALWLALALLAPVWAPAAGRSTCAMECCRKTGVCCCRKARLAGAGLRWAAERQCPRGCGAAVLAGAGAGAEAAARCAFAFLPPVSPARPAQPLPCFAPGFHAVPFERPPPARFPA